MEQSYMTLSMQMVRCEPDIDTCVLHPKAQKPTIIYHVAIPRLINFVFSGKSDVPFKYLKSHTGSANPFIILSSNYGSFQETEQISHLVGLPGIQPFWKWPKKDFFMGF